MIDIDTTTAPEAASVVLTLKGERYCAEHNQYVINGVPLPEGVTPQEWRASARKRINENLAMANEYLDAAKALIDALDFLATDPDLEPNGDDEPSLGWPAGHGVAQLRKDMAHDDDREHDDCDDEDNGDDEPLADDEPDHHSVPEYPEDPRKPQYVQSIQDGSYLTEMRDEREVRK